jgi:hypothetical protein
MKEVGPSGSAKPEKYLEFEAEVTVDNGTPVVINTNAQKRATGQILFETSKQANHMQTL